MTTTLANLLLGVDMEGGENFCDSVYNFLKNQGKDINLITNSGFGVWSQSDANKGLATLVYDNLAGGNFGVGDTITGATSGAVGKLQTDNGATSMTLGAVSGTFQDNEQIGNGAGVTADVNGESAIPGTGLNDSMSIDRTGEYGISDCTIAFDADHYEIDRTAPTQTWGFVSTGLTLTTGKIYKIEFDVKDGTAAGEDIDLYVGTGWLDRKIYDFTTTAAWVSHSATFEAESGDDSFGFRSNLGAGNYEIRRLVLYEITPCCTAADTVAMDGWIKDSTADIYRQHWDSTYSKCGSFYSLKIVPTAADDYVRFPGAIYDNEEWYKQFCEQPVTVGAWVYASVASHAKLVIQQTSGDTSSDYHTGTPGWEWLEVTAVIAANTAFFDIQLFCDATPNVDGTTIVYISQDMLVFGWSLGEGMYQPRLQEMIWLEKNIPSNTYDGLLNQSDLAFTDLNIEADSDAMLPKGAKVIAVHTEIDDSGSGAGLDVHLELRKDATAGTFFCNSVAGKPNDVHAHAMGLQSCDVNGDVDIHLDATGAGTLDINMFEYHGVQVN